MQRKIVQIAIRSLIDRGDLEAIFAVADDGTLWRMPMDSRQWERLPDLPQQDSEEVVKAALARGARGVSAI
jgi:hypothetical protein